MPVLKIFDTDMLAFSLPVNLASRTVFRFYTADNNGNNCPLTGFTSANFVIYPDGNDPVDMPLQIQANGDVILYILPNFWSFPANIFNCAIYLDNDYVPFISGTVSFGIVIQPNQVYGIMNASRNAVLVNGTQYENPLYLNSESVQFLIDIDNDGVAQISLTSDVTRVQIYEHMKEILQAGEGLVIIADDAEKTLTIEQYP